MTTYHQEIIERIGTNAAVIASIPAISTTPPGPGATIERCVGCDCKVWIHPLSQKQVSEERPGIRPVFICFNCVKYCITEATEITMPNEEVMAHVKEATAKPGNN